MSLPRAKHQQYFFFVPLFTVQLLKLALFSVLLVFCAISGTLVATAAAASAASTALAAFATVAAPEDANDELITLVIGLLSDPDRDVRALGFEQVRTDAKGKRATEQFAAQLSKLSPEAQVGLVAALADRADNAARPAVIELVRGTKSLPVRAAALKALGNLGSAVDVALLLEYLEKTGEKAEDVELATAARQGLSRLAGEDVSRAIAGALGNTTGTTRGSLIEVLVIRRATSAVPELLPIATGKDAAGRVASMAALAQLASPSDMRGLLEGVLRATAGAERESAEKSVAQVCVRVEDVDERAAVLLAEWKRRSAQEQTLLLSVLGRVGGTAVREVLEKAIASRELTMHETGLRALCNWPDAKIAPRYLELLKAEEHEEHRTLLLRALIRVAPLPDDRSAAERLALLSQCMQLSQRDAERQLVLARVSAIRTVESLRFVVPYLDHQSLAKQACVAVVELAHHRELRDANKAEFEKVLDRVLLISDDAIVKDRATRYKKGQTWTRPTK
ncbi:MAG: HEAT repeat domain-containing protein [Planctomycetota bacterium]